MRNSATRYEAGFSERLSDWTNCVRTDNKLPDSELVEEYLNEGATYQDKLLKKKESEDKKLMESEGVDKIEIKQMEISKNVVLEISMNEEDVKEVHEGAKIEGNMLNKKDGDRYQHQESEVVVMVEDQEHQIMKEFGTRGECSPVESVKVRVSRIESARLPTTSDNKKGRNFLEALRIQKLNSPVKLRVKKKSKSKRNRTIKNNQLFQNYLLLNIIK